MSLAIDPSRVDEAGLLRELRAFVEIETPSRNGEAVNRLADHVEAHARRVGLDVERRAGTLGFGDILVLRTPRPVGGSVPRILILAHIDTVHAVGTLAGRLPLRREGDRLYGPGVYDMKSGVAMAIEAMRLCLAHGPSHPVDLLIVPDEEVGSPSSRPAIEALAQGALAALVVEPARDGGKIVTARKGVGLCDITVRGRAAHAGVRPADGRSAIRAAARLVLELEALNDTERGITVTVGTIGGGTGRNTVPDECRLQVDLRLPDMTSAEEILKRIRALRPVDPDIRYEIAAALNRPPFASSAAGLEVFDEAARIADALGFRLEGVATGGGSDGNFTAALGIPTLDGLGADGAGAHTLDEHILLSSLVPRTALLANLLLRLPGAV
ncbi:M20 family metallopeptidase [Aureimonas sp. AU4]|uniref:M20 family metallopeptidase n=1 Tax=Aureimonas sp. AU4 TaxID=1638163 RepID=UPI0007845E96|nr:M20 family metallopeptidase [Aureimonas sp. AU4]